MGRRVKLQSHIYKGAAVIEHDVLILESAQTIELRSSKTATCAQGYAQLKEAPDTFSPRNLPRMIRKIAWDLDF